MDGWVMMVIVTGILRLWCMFKAVCALHSVQSLYSGMKKINSYNSNGEQEQGNEEYTGR